VREWQPIETAPTGGKWVLLWWPEITDCALVGYRMPLGWHCPIGDGYDESDLRGIGPTHWMPLPPPPESPNE
jgi:hypothetical protein